MRLCISALGMAGDRHGIPGRTHTMGEVHAGPSDDLLLASMIPDLAKTIISVAVGIFTWNHARESVENSSGGEAVTRLLAYAMVSVVLYFVHVATKRDGYTFASNMCNVFLSNPAYLGSTFLVPVTAVYIGMWFSKILPIETDTMAMSVVIVIGMLAVSTAMERWRVFLNEANYTINESRRLVKKEKGRL